MDNRVLLEYWRVFTKQIFGITLEPEIYYIVEFDLPDKITTRIARGIDIATHPWSEEDFEAFKRKKFKVVRKATEAEKVLYGKI